MVTVSNVLIFPLFKQLPIAVDGVVSSVETVNEVFLMHGELS